MPDLSSGRAPVRAVESCRLDFANGRAAAELSALETGGIA